MSDPQIFPEQTFRSRPDHGMNLPDGTPVLTADFGHVRASIWHDTQPRKIWDNRDCSCLVTELHHPVWRISAGYGSIAVSEKVAKFRAEEIARKLANLDPDPTGFTNRATQEEIMQDNRLLGLRNAEAIRFQIRPPGRDITRAAGPDF